MVFLRSLVPSTKLWRVARNLNEEGKARGCKMTISFYLFVFEKGSLVGHVLVLQSQFLWEWIVMKKKIHKLASPYLWFLFELEISILSDWALGMIPSVTNSGVAKERFVEIKLMGPLVFWTVNSQSLELN